MIALLGAVMGQAVVWYTGQFYALFFLERMLRVDGATTNILTAIALALATPGFIFFGWLSDRIGRKPIILAGCLLAALTYFPLFHALTLYANPALSAAQATAPVTRDRRSGAVLASVRSGRQEQIRLDLLRHRQEFPRQGGRLLPARRRAGRNRRADQGRRDHVDRARIRAR